ncbi:MmcQ/YjbR family DNA-binding protein [Pediococcus claussenii]|uniref:MmcQ family protein n=1 Tax=Pediococcus claussenii (strain ATCC BAA-344 / DSM 14800 / JCM 18046 / KCTC 3811 / LMG 21948 / P06) TaxID=701521 RepID=G8PEA6_PEDCP|nr:MmcQ/YjbR family DNA-binding protein [Pediococcus claussenii]AEV94367.1 hypothetical protein PECL_29 [Pediococcus claussenii ATCC BAA-344]ANZ69588.1 hypothetical protein AYR57_04330 [Pediococcus claussenii]ANZ71405.1 hypothetical protein AYR58_04335 [Pediococcus claussenii]KRN19372.1 hypothetical protein IV79_GL001422 [Pediococcus claussenii]
MYEDPIFKESKINPQKALEFGFTTDSIGNFVYLIPIMQDQFTLLVQTTEGSPVQTKLTDNITGTEYVLHHNPQGAYSRKVQVEYHEALLKIQKNAFTSAVFAESKTQDIIKYIQQTYGDQLEFLWKKTPKNAIVRRPDTNKWYAALLTIPQNKIGLIGDIEITVLNLHVEPQKVESVVDNRTYFPGYHMNKKHWISVYLNNDEPIENILLLLDNSYRLGKKK